MIEPDRVVREFKRRLGDHVPLLVGGSPFSAELLTARLLQWVISTCTERLGEPPEAVVLTHPANWGPFKREIFGQVATLADVPHVSWIPEPVAAAAQYASRARVEVGDKLAIYDLGGGTFDVCVVEKTLAGFVMLGSPTAWSTSAAPISITPCSNASWPDWSTASTAGTPRTLRSPWAWLGCGATASRPRKPCPAT